MQSRIAPSSLVNAQHSAVQVVKPRTIAIITPPQCIATPVMRRPIAQMHSHFSERGEGQRTRLVSYLRAEHSFQIGKIKVWHSQFSGAKILAKDLHCAALEADVLNEFRFGFPNQELRHLHECRSKAFLEGDSLEMADAVLARSLPCIFRQHDPEKELWLLTHPVKALLIWRQLTGSSWEEMFARWNSSASPRDASISLFELSGDVYWSKASNITPGNH